MNTFKQEIVELLSNERGGHVQRHLYSDNTRPDGKSGTWQWHNFVAANNNYYPIRAEIKMVSALIKNLRKDYETVVDFGIGDEMALKNKVVPILRSQKDLQRYYAIDISRGQLDNGLMNLKRVFPHVVCQGICNDFYRKQNGIWGSKRLGLFLGSTISNIDMRVGENFPTQSIIQRINTLGHTLYGGSSADLIISADCNQNLDVAMAAYQHDSWHKMMAGIVYDLQKILEPKGNFDPDVWEYKGIVDYQNRVLHQTIMPTQDQELVFENYAFKISKGAPFVVTNNWKPDLDQFLELIRRAGLTVQKVLRDTDHPVVMVNAKVQ